MHRWLALLAASLAAAFLSAQAFSQDGGEVESLYAKQDYKAALDKATARMAEIYDARSGDRLTPSEYSIMKNLESGKSLLQKAYRERKPGGFFIESNPELSTLHVYAARSYHKLGKFDHALNHYTQALRFRVIESGRDDTIFHEIAQVYKDQNQPEAYSRMLEAAYELNPAKAEYSLELGMSLSKTNEKKKSIFHLERYVRSKGDAEDPKLYLLLGNLYEDTGRYLDTVENYKKYLRKKQDDGYIHFALGFLAYKRTGNYGLARSSFTESLKHIPKDDILRRSKISEYMGDIHMKDLEFDKAAQVYQDTAKYQEEILTDIRGRIDEIKKIRGEIQKIKKDTVKKADETGADYFAEQEKKGKLELDNREREYLFTKLNAGKIRWNLAWSYERLGDYNKAIDYYNRAVAFDYNSNQARERIRKLQLKIIRGY
jgi:tetratricopeptide (TPR) repeat protein